MANEPLGNPVKAVFNPLTGVTSNYIATNPGIPVPDMKHDPLHGHIDVNQQGVLGYQRMPGDPRP
jgi:hypothetical protein